MQDFDIRMTPGFPLLLCGQGLLLEHGLASVFLGYFSDSYHSGLRLTLR